MGMIWDLPTAKRHHRRSPGIAERLVELLPPDQPVLDLGCGPGYYLSLLAARGFRCLGVEGTPAIHEIADFAEIVEADLSRPLSIAWPRSTVLCLEVGEHIDPSCEETLIANIDQFCSRFVVLSWAVPGQRGRGHVNCRPNSYVYERFRRRGFELHPEMTFALRESAEDHVKYFRNTLLVLERRDRIPCTLARMADDERVDLPSAESQWNLEMALSSAEEGSLSASQLARRTKILKHFGQ